MKRGVAIVALVAVVGWGAARIVPPLGIFRPAAPAALATLREILRSKNDNDPRLDSDFDALSSETKALFRAEYRKLPPERRNERGTIVYLLGKNMRSPQDWAFLREVVSEPPCLSLADCSRKSAPEGREEGLGDEVTLAYPGLVALKQTQRALEAAPHDSAALSVLAAAKKSQAPAVATLAGSLFRRFACAAHHPSL
jgi:hypothetical protein